MKTTLINFCFDWLIDIQNLGGEHVDMILEFSLDILSEDEEGFLIFTEVIQLYWSNVTICLLVLIKG